MGKLIHKLLWEDGYYPFSMKYNPKKTFEKIELEYSELEVDDTSKSIVTYSYHFNNYFKEICKSLETVLKKSKLNKEQFIDLLIADLNRTEIVISGDTIQVLESQKTIDMNAMSNVYIQKPEFQNISEPVWGIIDAAIDTSILNLNHLKYIKFSMEEDTVIENEIEQVDVIKFLGNVGSFYNSIKHAYDRIIWNHHHIEYIEDVMYLRQNSNHLMLDNVGLTRLSRNISGKYQEIKYNSKAYKDEGKQYHQTRTHQEISKIELKDDKLIIKYKSKKSIFSDSFCSYIAPLLTYYPFYRSKKIKKFDDLTIFDLVNLFSILHDLVNLLPFPNYDDTEVKDLEKFTSFNPKLTQKEIVNHFKKTTKYSENQILIFIDLLTQKGDSHNLYRYPIYENGGFMFFALSIIKRANILYLIDKWLEMGECDLSDRGYEFEDYITNFLMTEDLNEFAKFKKIERSTFSFKNDNSEKFEEEIDLVLLTESTLILAEVKCIVYPLEQKDYYTSYQTIKKAKKQIERKAKFIEDNWDHFKDDLGERNTLKIEKIIIVNFPHYTGHILDGIPVADFYLFLSYFQSGKFHNIKLEKGKEPVYNFIPYYNSVKSFESNFGSFFQRPLPVQDLINRQAIEEYEVSIKGNDPKIIGQRVIYNAKC